MSTVQQTLEARGKHYEGPGGFTGTAHTSQMIKTAYLSGSNWRTLPSEQREALELIAGKIARILNGNPNHADSWHDIAGYATLVEKLLPEQEVSTTPYSDYYNKLVAGMQQAKRNQGGVVLGPKPPPYFGYGI